MVKFKIVSSFKLTVKGLVSLGMLCKVKLKRELVSLPHNETKNRKEILHLEMFGF
jgi:hypothetical protein